MKVLTVSHQPAVSVRPDDTVLEALETMTEKTVGAVVVVEEERVVGIFTRRDAIERVILKSLPIDSTQVYKVMTFPVDVLTTDTEVGDAMTTMASRPFNHLPVVDENSKVVGLVTTKRVMKKTIERLGTELDTLEAFITADGIGG